MVAPPTFAPVQEFVSLFGGDVVVKLVVHTRTWCGSHAAERAAKALLAIDRFLHAVASLVPRRRLTPAQAGAHVR